MVIVVIHFLNGLMALLYDIVIFKVKNVFVVIPVSYTRQNHEVSYYSIESVV
jgi:hypothetical protein